MLSELRNRGLQDALIVCCDGLKGLPESIRLTWPLATVQTCVVHMVRNSLRYASKKHWSRITAAMREIYTAPTIEAAETRFADFAADWEALYPAMISGWRSVWNEFVPFLGMRDGVGDYRFDRLPIDRLRPDHPVGSAKKGVARAARAVEVVACHMPRTQEPTGTRPSSRLNLLLPSAADSALCDPSASRLSKPQAAHASRAAADTAMYRRGRGFHKPRAAASRNSSPARSAETRSSELVASPRMPSSFKRQSCAPLARRTTASPVVVTPAILRIAGGGPGVLRNTRKAS